MTLIMAFGLDGVPVMVGDVVLSGEVLRGNDFRLPMRPSRPSKTSDGRDIVGLQQKLVVLSDDLAVAWTGRWDQATTVLRALEAAVQKQRADEECIERALRSVPETERDRVSLVGTLGDDTIWRRFTYGGDVHEVPVAGLDTPMFAGSGFTEGFRVLRDTELRPHAVHQAFVVAGNLVDQERSTAAPTDFGFGGAFEIVWPETKPGGGGTRLAKLSGVTSVYGSVDAVGDRLKVSIDAVSQNVYRDGILLHVVVRFTESGPTWHPYAIPSPLGEVPEPEWIEETLHTMELRPDLLGSFFSVVKGGMVVGHVAHCEAKEDRNLSMFRINGTVRGGVSVEWTDVYANGILEAARGVLDAYSRR